MQITYKGINFDAEYYHQPEQKEDRETEYLPESIILEELNHYGDDFYDFLTEEQVTEIEKLIMQELNEYHG